MKDIIQKLKSVVFTCETSDIRITNILGRYAFIIILTIATYFITVTSAGTLMSNAFISNRTSANSHGKFTVEFFGTEGDINGILTKKQKQDVIKTLNSTKGVINAKCISNSEMQNMFERWVPGLELPKDLPMPTLFNIETIRSDNITTADISAKLSKINKNVRVYDHSVVSSSEIRLNSMLQLLTVIILTVSLVMAATIIYYFVNNSIEANRNTIHILRMIGATERYINREVNSLTISTYAKSILWSSLISIFTFIACYGVLFPVNILEYVFICSSILLATIAVMFCIVAGVSRLSVSLIYRKNVISM